MRIGLLVEYDGTGFHGSQLQSNARTVQGEIERALLKIFKRKIRIYLASRTDSGVHARGQVGRFDQKTDMSPDQIRKALNYHMTKDVRIMCAQRVQGGPEGFDPRRDAVSRTYVYTFNDSQFEPALGRHFVTHVRKNLDVVIMNNATQAFIGSHDFAAFAGPSTPDNAPTRRVVEHASAIRYDDNVEITFTANAYLHQQMRRIVGVLYDIGRGNAPLNVVDELLSSEKRGAASNVMPATGLCLTKIGYNGSGECGLPVYASIGSVDLGVN